MIVRHVMFTKTGLAYIRKRNTMFAKTGSAHILLARRTQYMDQKLSYRGILFKNICKAYEEGLSPLRLEKYAIMPLPLGSNMKKERIVTCVIIFLTAPNKVGRTACI